MKFTISRPVKRPFVTQVFGVNGEYYRKNGINVNGHNGQDYVAPHGEPILATHDGTVTYAGGEAKEGVGVVVTTDQKYEYEGKETFFKSIYWHLCLPTCHEGKHKIPVAFGQKVKKGDVIGYANNTGFSTGDHLHFSIKPVAQGESQWTWWNTEQNNGYGGAIDPEPFFERFPRDLFYGDTGKDVSELQAQLVVRGFLLTKDFGFYGIKTLFAVVAFQKAYLLPVTGRFGRETREKLSELMNTP